MADRFVGVAIASGPRETKRDAKCNQFRQGRESVRLPRGAAAPPLHTNTFATPRLCTQSECCAARNDFNSHPATDKTFRNRRRGGPPRPGNRGGRTLLPARAE